MAKDFQSKQLRSTVLITSGGVNTGGMVTPKGTGEPLQNLGMVVYSASVSSDFTGGVADTKMLAGVGDDVYLFFSGSRSTYGEPHYERQTVTLFGGDMVVSGTLFADRMVVEVDEVQRGDLLVTGNLEVRPHTDTNRSVIFETAAGGDIFVISSENKSFRVTGSISTKGANDRSRVYFLSGTSVAKPGHAPHEDKYADTNFFVSGTIGSKDRRQNVGGVWANQVLGTAVFGGDMVVSGAIYDSVGNQIGGGGGGWTDEGAYVRLTTLADKVSIGVADATAPDAKLEVLGTTEQLRLSYDQSNQVSFTVDSGGDLTIDPNGNNTILDGDLQVKGNSGGSNAKIDLGVENSSLGGIIEVKGTNSGDGENLQIIAGSTSDATSTKGGMLMLVAGDASANTATGASQIKLFTKRPGQAGRFERIKLDGNELNISGSISHKGDAATDKVYFLSGTAGAPGLSLNEAAYTDTNFFVSGTIESKRVHGQVTNNEVMGTAVFGGDMVVSGNLYVSGSTLMQDSGWLDDGTTVRLRAGTDNVSIGSDTMAAHAKLNVAGVVLATGSISQTGTATDKVFLLSGSNVTAPGLSPTEDGYQDTSFFVSGSIGSKNGTSLGTSLFGGDLVVSGNLYVSGSEMVQAAWMDEGAYVRLRTQADKVSIGVADGTTPDAKLEVLSTTEQLRLSYDQSNELTFTVDSGGDANVKPSGGTLKITDGAGSGGSAFSSANNLVVDGAGSTGITILSPAAQNSYLVFGTDYNAIGAYLAWDNTNGKFKIIGNSTKPSTFEIIPGNGAGSTLVISGVLKQDRIMMIHSGVGNTAATNHSVSDPGYVGNPKDYADANFYVSGSIGSKDLRQAGGAWSDQVMGTSVFGGDMVVSGTIYDKDGNSISGGGSSWVDEGAFVRLATPADNVSIGVAAGVAPDAKLEVLGTTEQLRLSYDQSNEASFTVSSGGDLTITPNGNDTTLTGNAKITNAELTLGVFGTTKSAEIAAANVTSGNGNSIFINAGQSFDAAATEGGHIYISANRTSNAASTSKVVISTGKGGVSTERLRIDADVTNISGSISHKGNAATDKVFFLSGTSVAAPGLAPNEAKYADTNFFVSGTIGSKDLRQQLGGVWQNQVAGVAVFGGDVVVSGSIYNAEGYVDGGGWTDTGATVRLTTAADTVGVGTDSPDAKLEILSTTTQLRLTHTDATDYVTFTVDTNGDMVILGSGDELKLDSFTQFKIQPSNASITAQAVFHPDNTAGTLSYSSDNQEFGLDRDTKLSSTNKLKFSTNNIFISQPAAGVLGLASNEKITFSDGSSGTVSTELTGSLSLLGAALSKVFLLSGSVVTLPGHAPNEDRYQDANFFVSGTMSSRGTSTLGTAVFGGDLMVSGGIYLDERTSGAVPTPQANSGFFFLDDADGHIKFKYASSVGVVTTFDLTTAGGGSGAPAAADYVTLSTDATLTNERVLTQGNGVSVTDGGAGTTVTLAAVADSTTGGNIQPANVVANGIGVDISAIAGNGIEADGSANLRLSTQGNGIAGGAGSTLSVNPDSTTGGNIQPVNVVANGVGLDISAIIGDGVEADGSGNINVKAADSTISVAGGGISVVEANLSGIPNSALSNSTVTIDGQAVALGGTHNVGWLDDGTTVRLTTSTDKVSIGSDTMAGHAKLNVDGTILVTGSISQRGSATDKVFLLSGSAVTAPGLSPSEDNYLDTSFFVSGSVGSKNGTSLGTSLFGGDVVVSGSMYLEELSAAPETPGADSGVVYSRDLGGNTKLFFKNGSGTEYDLTVGGIWADDGSYIRLTNNADTVNVGASDATNPAAPASTQDPSTKFLITDDGNSKYSQLKLMSGNGGGTTYAAFRVAAGTGAGNLMLDIGPTAFGSTPARLSIGQQLAQSVIITASGSMGTSDRLQFWVPTTAGGGAIDQYTQIKTHARIGAAGGGSDGPRLYFDNATTDGGNIASSANIRHILQGDGSTPELVIDAASGEMSVVLSGSNNKFRIRANNGSIKDFIGVLPHSTNGSQILLMSGVMPGPLASTGLSMDPQRATDVNFFVSGSIGSRGTGALGANNSLTRGTAVFGGDVVVSGTLYDSTGALQSVWVDEGTYVRTSTATDAVTVGENSDPEASSLEVRRGKSKLQITADALASGDYWQLVLKSGDGASGISGMPSPEWAGIRAGDNNGAGGALYFQANTNVAGDPAHRSAGNRTADFVLQSPAAEGISLIFSGSGDTAYNQPNRSGQITWWSNDEDSGASGDTLERYFQIEDDVRIGRSTITSDGRSRPRLYFDHSETSGDPLTISETAQIYADVPESHITVQAATGGAVNLKAGTDVNIITTTGGGDPALLLSSSIAKVKIDMDSSADMFRLYDDMLVMNNEHLYFKDVGMSINAYADGMLHINSDGSASGAASPALWLHAGSGSINIEAEKAIRLRTGRGGADRIAFEQNTGTQSAATWTEQFNINLKATTNAGGAATTPQGPRFTMASNIVFDLPGTGTHGLLISNDPEDASSDSIYPSQLLHVHGENQSGGQSGGIMVSAGADGSSTTAVSSSIAFSEIRRRDLATQAALVYSDVNGGAGGLADGGFTLVASGSKLPLSIKANPGAAETDIKEFLKIIPDSTAGSRVMILSGVDGPTHANSGLGTDPSSAVDINFFVSGSIGSAAQTLGVGGNGINVQVTNGDRGTALFGGDVVMSGSLFVSENSIYVGGEKIGASNGKVTFLDTAESGSVFTDTNFYVSGTIGSIGTATPGAALFGGDLVTSGTAHFNLGLSGSLTKLTDGNDYLRGGTGISISTGSSGQITISTNDAAGGTITVMSGSTSVASVDTIDLGQLGILSNPESGTASLTGSIGNAEDGDYGDGLFTGFTSKTPIGTAIDKFNEVLKALAPAPAPDLDDVDGYGSATATSVFLSFGSSNAVGGYTNVTALGGLSAVDKAGQYTEATGSTSPGSNRLGGFGTHIDVYGNLNADIAKKDSGSNLNYTSGSFGNADQGELQLWVNGSQITFDGKSGSPTAVDLTDGTVGTGLPGVGSDNSFVNSDGTGIINISAIKDATAENGSSLAAFRHRTGRFKVAAANQRNGHNYVQVKHVIGSTITTNYVEWVNDNNANALSAASENLAFSGAGSKTLSGVTYYTAASVTYTSTISNAFRNVYDTTALTFTAGSSDGALSGAARSNLSYSLPNQAKPTPANNLSTIAASSNDADMTADYVLGGTLTANVTVTHPLKTNLTNGGSASATQVLMYNVSESSTVTLEAFQGETHRLQSGSYGSSAAIAGGAWTASTALTNTGAYSGLQTYRERLYAPANTLNSGNFSTLTNGPGSNPNYTSLSGLRTYYRKFQHTVASTIYGFKYEISGNGTLVSAGSALGSSNNNFRLFFKLPDNGTTDTGWLDAAQTFAYHSSSLNRGGGAAPGISIDTSTSMTNYIAFGTGSITQNAYVLAKVEADPTWTGYLDDITVTFTNSGGSGTAPDTAPNLDNINTTQDGTDVKLSFGSSNAISGYTNVTAIGSLSAVNANGSFSSATAGNDKQIAAFTKTTDITGNLNDDVSAGNGYSADAFGAALDGQVVLEVNGSEILLWGLGYGYGAGSPGAGTDDSAVGGNGSGFLDMSLASPATYGTNDVPDFNKMYRTGKWNVDAGSSDQRLGFNYARVIHRKGGGDVTTNYVTWINDSDANALAESTVGMANFEAGGGSTYTLSGISYFTQPRTTYFVTASNVYKNVYSGLSNAVTANLTNLNIASITISGDGVNNATVNSDSTVPLPDLNTGVSNPQDSVIKIAIVSDLSTSKILPGSTYGQSASTTAQTTSTIIHPLKSNLTTSAASKSSFLVWSGNSSGTTNEYTSEAFKNESYRIVSGSYTTQGAVASGGWTSTTSMNDAGAPTYEDGLLIYNSYLLSPKNSDISGDFRSVGDGGSLQAPTGNPNYSSLNESSRAYYRYFENNTTNDVSSITITITGDATIVARNGGSNIGANKNIYVDVKIPGDTGFLDLGRSTAGAGNISNGDGCLVGSLDATVDGGGASNSASFNGQTLAGTVSGEEKVVIRIQAHESWTGYITGITVSY